MYNTQKSACSETRTLTTHASIYYQKVEHEITVKNLDVTHEIHFAIHGYSSTISAQLFLSLRHPIEKLDVKNDVKKDVKNGVKNDVKMT